MIRKIKRNIVNLKPATAFFKNMTTDNANPFKFIANDSSSDLTRLMTTFENGAFIISASRGQFDRGVDYELKKYNFPYPKENYKNEEELLTDWNAWKTNMLEQDLRKYGLGFRASMGGYVENGEDKVDEMSFVVPYNKNKMSEEEFIKIARDLCEKYNQESVFLTLPWMDKAIWMTRHFDINGLLNKKMNLANPNYYTQTRKTNSPKFEFELEQEYDNGDKDDTTKIADKKKVFDSVSKNVLLVESFARNLRLRYDLHGWHNED